jgi:hypothetical protein
MYNINILYIYIYYRAGPKSPTDRTRLTSGPSLRTEKIRTSGQNRSRSAAPRHVRCSPPAPISQPCTRSSWRPPPMLENLFHAAGARPCCRRRSSIRSSSLAQASDVLGRARRPPPARQRPPPALVLAQSCTDRDLVGSFC